MAESPKRNKQKIVNLSMSQNQKPNHANLSEIKSSLDNMSLQLLRDRFLRVDVETYYKIAEMYMDKTLKYDKKYRRAIVERKPLETLIRLSMDKVASAYVLISGQADKSKVDALLSDYTSLIENYLKSAGFHPSDDEQF